LTTPTAGANNQKIKTIATMPLEDALHISKVSMNI